MNCTNCPFAKWDYCWFTCFISGKVYEDGEKGVPKKCPFDNMTLKECKEKIKKRLDN
jgi:hypothetical protein